MNGIIDSIADLKSVVKINASMPFDSIVPYVNDAADIYLRPYVGDEVLSSAASAEGGDTLKSLVRRALGPLSLALATDELGVMYGDAGITVQNEQGKRSPANDSKIQAAKENLMMRGMHALDRLMDWLRSHPEGYGEFIDIDNGAAAGCFIRSAMDYQNNGCVFIDSSTVAFRQLLPTLLQLQTSDIRPLLTEEVFNRLLKKEDLNAKQTALRYFIVLYLANRSAGLFTSQNSRRQRQGSRLEPEFQPVIRPVYYDQDDQVNFFFRQADFYQSQIASLISSSAEELGLPEPSDGLMHYNSKEHKFVTSIL